MQGSLFQREVLPFFAALGALVAAALGLDLLLHLLGVVWIGRWLGIPGVGLILGSFAYSLRKRKLISSGTPKELLRRHERMAWAGCLLILVHAGIHFNAILGWLAVCSMLVNVASGLTGKYLLQRARRRLDDNVVIMRQQGLAGPDLDERMYWDSFTFDAVKNWRLVHYPITLAFAALALAHIISILLFWSWR
jgi:hypothetical protein